jgi:hypothetical protein
MSGMPSSISIHSGEPIQDERLERGRPAELTAEEQRAHAEP